MLKYLPILIVTAVIGLPVAAQDADTLFYGDTPVVHENPYGAGYIAGTNGYDDTGKYQRFDFDDDAYIVGAILYFGVVEVVGTANTINVVVRLVGDQGAPGQAIHSKEITTDEIVAGEGGHYVEFDEAVHIEADNENGVSAFIGFEWLTTVDDNFAVYADQDGEGDGANRAWERFDDNSFNDFLTVLNPNFSWDIDVDLWIAALYTTTPVSVDHNVHNAYSFELQQNYPNPFNPVTTIRYTIPENNHVILAVYNTLGQRVDKIIDGEMTAGRHSITYDASHLPSGVYMYRIQAGEYSDIKKLMLVK